MIISFLIFNIIYYFGYIVNAKRSSPAITETLNKYHPGICGYCLFNPMKIHLTVSDQVNLPVFNAQLRRDPLVLPSRPITFFNVSYGEPVTETSLSPGSRFRTLQLRWHGSRRQYYALQQRFRLEYFGINAVDLCPSAVAVSVSVVDENGNRSACFVALRE